MYVIELDEEINMNIEKAFMIRDIILNETGKHSTERNILQNILTGEYDKLGEEGIAEAYNGLFTLKVTQTDIIPIVGQVWVVKEDKTRVWRRPTLTINYVSVDPSSGVGYFTYEEQADAESCWCFDLLENYNLVKGVA